MQIVIIVAVIALAAAVFGKIMLRKSGVMGSGTGCNCGSCGSDDKGSQQ